MGKEKEEGKGHSIICGKKRTMQVGWQSRAREKMILKEKCSRPDRNHKIIYGSINHSVVSESLQSHEL